MKKILLVLAFLLTACSVASSEFVVSNVVYDTNPADPNIVTTVIFDLDRPAEVVGLIVDGKSFVCESETSAYTHWTCPLDAATTLTKDTSMRVVALGNR